MAVNEIPTCLSRRGVLKLAGLAVLQVGLPDEGRGQEPEAPLKATLRRSIDDARLLAVAPDGKRVCLYFTRHPGDSFTFRRGRWTNNNAMADHSDDVLRVVDLDSWKTVFTAQLRAKAEFASFFADSERLYARTAGFFEGKQFSTQHAVAGLRGPKIDEQLRPERPREGSSFYTALADDVLLGMELSGGPRRHEALTLVDLPDYHELARVPFATGIRDEILRDSDVWVSADRTTVIYSFDRTIVCRRTEDLQVAWTYPIEAKFYEAKRLAVSANGSHVAAAIVGRRVNNTRIYYTGIYDGRSGALLAKRPIDGGDGLTISPSGQLLAVGRGVPDPKTGDLEVVCDLYDMKSDRPLATLSHHRVPRSGNQFLNGSLDYDGIQFTSDGKHLITSGNNRVKVWELARDGATF